MLCNGTIHRVLSLRLLPINPSIVLLETKISTYVGVTLPLCCLLFKHEALIENE